MTCVTGLIATQPCSQSGSVQAGTKVDDPKVSGNTTRNEMPWTAPELRASMPMNTETQQRLTANTMSSRNPNATSCERGVEPESDEGAEQQRDGDRDRVADDVARARPRTAELTAAIGSDRNRSKTPFLMSVLRFTPMVSEVNMIVCTMMPGSANCR